MSLLYEEIFLALLAAYSAYSIYARLDGRYPIAGALILLVSAAVLDVAGAMAAANTVTIFVFFLLGAGVVLLLVEHLRAGEASGPTGPPAVPREGKSREVPPETDPSRHTSPEAPDPSPGAPPPESSGSNGPEGAPAGGPTSTADAAAVPEEPPNPESTPPEEGVGAAPP